MTSQVVGIKYLDFFLSIEKRKGYFRHCNSSLKQPSKPTPRKEKGLRIWFGDYYPFGLTMAGISSKALNNTPNNKYKFNGGNELQSGEFADGSGLELFDAINRVYDPQLGRFWQIDELAKATWEESVYSFAHNNPIQFNDPQGLAPEEPAENGGKAKQLRTVVITGYSTKAKIRIYWELINTNTDFAKVSSPSLRQRMYFYDGIQKFKDKTQLLQRKQEIVVLEIASWLIPAGHLTKLRYLKYAAQLFKLKKHSLHIRSC